MMTLRSFPWLAVLAATLLGGGAAGAAGVSDPLERSAHPLRRAGTGMLLALARTDGNTPRLFAAGERGIIVFSDDSGRSWRQAKVPVAVTLTALDFPVPNQGWAVGHGGVILHSADAGQTWVKQLDGVAAARIADEAAKSGSDAALQAHTAQLVGDGADKPFMAVHFSDDRHGFVVGAYGLIFGTDDGGASWHPWLDRVNNPRGLHLNAIAVTGKLIYLAGEQGLFMRSTDQGKSFQKVETPYQGSFFTAVADGDMVLIGGLKGNLLRSDDRGDSFEKLAGVPPINLLSGGKSPDGAFFFVNQSGQLLLSSDRGHSLQAVSVPAGTLPTLTAIPHADGSWTIAGQRGVGHISSKK